MDQLPMVSVSLGGIEVGFRLPTEQTAGVVSAVEVRVAPGRLALPHRHEREDELCLVVDGQVGWRVGDRELLADPDSVIFLPRGVPHAYWNPGRSLARLVLVSMPGGVERFFQELVTGSMEVASGPRRWPPGMGWSWCPSGFSTWSLDLGCRCVASSRVTYPDELAKPAAPPLMAATGDGDADC
jgi:quercetin dioxygenase-like cupin family protein